MSLTVLKTLKASKSDEGWLLRCKTLGEIGYYNISLFNLWGALKALRALAH